MTTYMNQWKWPSNSSDKEYTISLTFEGQFQCSCRGWTMQVPRRDCTHIRQLKASDALKNGVRFSAVEL